MKAEAEGLEPAPLFPRLARLDHAEPQSAQVLRRAYEISSLDTVNAVGGFR